MSTFDRQNAPATSPDDYVPFRIDTTRPPVDAERIPLFYIDDREYTGPARLSAGMALRALEMAARRGVEAAAFWCLIEAIGQEAYDDLVNCPQVEYEQAQSLLTRISAMYFGQARGIAGK